MSLTGTYSPEPFLQFLGGQGQPLAGGHLATYVTQSYTYANTYADVSLLTINPNPIVLDAAGRSPTPIFLIPGQSYRYVLTDPTGANIAFADDIQAVPTSLKNAQFGIQPTTDWSTTNVTPIWADFTPMTGTILTRGGAVLAQAVFPGVMTPSGVSGFAAVFQWNIDGADVGVISGLCPYQVENMVSLQWNFANLSVGTHQIKLRVMLNQTVTGGTFTSHMLSVAGGSLSLLEVNV